MKPVSLLLAAGLGMSLAVPAGAQNFGFSTSGSGPSSDVRVPRTSHGGVVLTQNSDTGTITDLNSVSCNAGGSHADNSYYRRFDLDGGSGLTGSFEVVGLDLGVETASSPGGDQPIDIILHTIPNGDPLVLANLTQVGISNTTVADTNLAIVNFPVTSSPIDPLTSDLVVEVFTPNGQADGTRFFIGSNANGETAPSYLRAPDCSVSEPTSTGTLGFPNMHILMLVNGFESTDVGVDVTESADPVTAGSGAGNLTHTVTATAVAGQGSNLSIDVSQTLPSGVSVDAMTPSQGTVTGSTWDVGTLAPGSSATLDIDMTAGGGTSAGTDVVETSASISALDEDDDVPGNDSDTEATSVDVSVDLSVSIAASASEVTQGQSFDYIIDVINNGPSAASNVVLTDNLPTGMSLDASTGCLEDPSGVPTCTIGPMASGETATVILTTRVYDARGQMTNEVSVQSDTADAAPGDNSASHRMHTLAMVPSLGTWAVGLLASILFGLGLVVVARR